MPILRAVLMTRQAISPRLAIRILVNMSWRPRRSKRNVVVLAPRVIQFLLPQHGQRAGDALAGGVGHDHVVDEAASTGHERVGELFLVLGFALGQLFRIALFLAEDDFHRALRKSTRLN